MKRNLRFTLLMWVMFGLVLTILAAITELVSMFISGFDIHTLLFILGAGVPNAIIFYILAFRGNRIHNAMYNWLWFGEDL